MIKPEEPGMFAETRDMLVEYVRFQLANDRKNLEYAANGQHIRALVWKLDQLEARIKELEAAILALDKWGDI